MSSFVFYRRLTNSIRVLLLILAVLGLVTFASWASLRPQVDDIEHWLVTRYESPYRNRLANARQNLDTQPDVGVVDLQDLLDDLQEVRARDRLDPVKREAYRLLFDTLYQGGDLAQALQWVERWVEFDQNDLRARVGQAQTLVRIPSRRQEGQALFSRIFKLAPEVHWIAEAYALDLLQYREDVERFVDIVEGLQASQRSRVSVWRVYWDGGHGYREQDSLVVNVRTTAEDVGSLRCEIPAATQALRIDPLAGQPLLLLEPTLSVDYSDRTVSQAVLEQSLGLHEILLAENALVVSDGTDPYFHWTLSPEQSGGLYEVRFQAVFRTMLPQRIAQLLATDSFTVLQEQVVQSGQTGLARRMRALRRGLLQQRPFQLFWASAGTPFSERHSRWVYLGPEQSGLPGSAYDLHISIDDNVDRLRMDFPELEGIIYEVKSIEVVTSSSNTRFDPDEVGVLDLNSLEREKNRFRVVGNDPSFTVEIPNGEHRAIALQVRGIVL
jgi:tetratricopeptide (TPR) repeat protein